MNIIVNSYYPDALCGEDAVRVELLIDGEIVMEGDFYHNHIQDRIKGFMQAVEYLHGKGIIKGYDFKAFRKPNFDEKIDCYGHDSVGGLVTDERVVIDNSLRE